VGSVKIKSITENKRGRTAARPQLSNLKRDPGRPHPKEGNMSNKPTTPNLQPYSSLETIARRIRDREERMREHGADQVRLAMASGDDLLQERHQFTEHGTWLPRLQKVCKACGLKQRQALNYVKLAQNRKAVEQYLHRGANLGQEASIKGALRFISPPTDRPKRPKKLVELQTPQVLGQFLEDHPDLFWASLQLAPKLRAGIAQRSPTGTESAKPSLEAKAAQSAAEGRAILELLKQPTSTNIDTAREKAARIVRLSHPAKPVPVAPKPPTLDTTLFARAMGLAA
jgi:hypothetical protein